MIRRIMAMGIGLTLMPLAVAIADDVGPGEEVVVIQDENVVMEPPEQPVTETEKAASEKPEMEAVPDEAVPAT